MPAADVYLKIKNPLTLATNGPPEVVGVVFRLAEAPADENRAMDLVIAWVRGECIAGRKPFPDYAMDDEGGFRVDFKAHVRQVEDSADTAIERLLAPGKSGRTRGIQAGS